MDTEEKELWNSRDQLLAQNRPSELVFDPAEHGVSASWSKPQSATNLYACNSRHKMRNVSVQFNSGIPQAYKSGSGMEKSGSIGNTHADRDTNVESSTNKQASKALIRNEHRQVKDYAKARYLQRHDRKLYRPQTSGMSCSGKQVVSRSEMRHHLVSSTNFGNTNEKKVISTGSGSVINLNQDAEWKR